MAFFNTVKMISMYFKNSGIFKNFLLQYHLPTEKLIRHKDTSQ